MRLVQIVLCFAAFCVLGQPDRVLSQTIRGVVLDPTGRALAGARLNLRQDNYTTVAESDSVGRFVFVLPRAGAVVIRTDMLGYATLDSSRVLVQPNELVEITITMSRDPIQIEPIVVTARRLEGRHQATYEGFLARREAARPIGNERVLLRSDAEMVNAQTIDDVLKWLPAPRCLAVFLNGKPTLNARASLEVPVAHLEGIEFYRYHTLAPLEFRGTHSACVRATDYSVLALWLMR